VLLTHGQLSEEARARMQVMVETEDGFVIAEKDLQIRGPGDFFGTRQSGLPTFRVAHLLRDRDLIERARKEAFHCAAAWKEGGPPAPLRAFLEGGAWETRFRLARVG
jgi:ATP-dependent DNA helicase RecG